MGHRKGQATCSSPIHRISAHNYMSERELNSILWRPKVAVSSLLSFGRRHYRAHCHIFTYCEHSRVSYNKTCPRTGNYALNADVPRTRAAFFPVVRDVIISTNILIEQTVFLKIF
ncbi:hypothetical protein ACS0PU_001563 [Formica fusca]